MRVSRRLAAQAAAALAAISLAACAGPRYPGANLPEAASPRQVVAAYLRALDAHDATAAGALATAGYRPVARSWAHATARLVDVHVLRVQRDNSYRPGGERVDTSFVYTGRRNNATFPNGAHYWSYWLLRQDGRWQISDQGTG